MSEPRPGENRPADGENPVLRVGFVVALALVAGGALVRLLLLVAKDGGCDAPAVSAWVSLSFSVGGLLLAATAAAWPNRLKWLTANRAMVLAVAVLIGGAACAVVTEWAGHGTPTPQQEIGAMSALISAAAVSIVLVAKVPPVKQKFTRRSKRDR